MSILNLPEWAVAEVLRAKMLHAELRKNARPRYDRDIWVA